LSFRSAGKGGVGSSCSSYEGWLGLTDGPPSSNASWRRPLSVGVKVVSNSAFVPGDLRSVESLIDHRVSPFVFLRRRRMKHANPSSAPWTTTMTAIQIPAICPRDKPPGPGSEDGEVVLDK
jgi:hypothetical protein